MRSARVLGAARIAEARWDARPHGLVPASCEDSSMRSVLAALLLPPTGFLLLLALLALAKGTARWRRISVGAAALLLWMAGSQGVVAPLAHAWAPATAQPTQAMARADQSEHTLVLVLGGGVRRGGGPAGEYEPNTETLERLHRGVWWARQFGLPLAFTGGRSPNPQADQPTEAAVVQRVLAAHYGLQPVWVEDRSSNTAENARFSVEFLRKRGIRRVLLVTHALHMPRAMRHFHTAAPEVEFIPAPLSQALPSRWALLDFVPSPEGIRLGRYLAYEWLANATGH